MITVWTIHEYQQVLVTDFPSVPKGMVVYADPAKNREVAQEFETWRIAAIFAQLQAARHGYKIVERIWETVG